MVAEITATTTTATIASTTTTASNGACFQCFFSNDETAPSSFTTDTTSCATSTTTSTCVYSFHLEANKKSSFLLEAPTEDFQCEKPAHFMVEATATANDKQQQQHQRVPFVLGGFEIVTNSRNIEVYVTNDDEDEKETYITTCRGIKYIEGQDLWYKALLVIPGGPRSMKRLRLKLLSLRPPTTTKSLFSFMKLKGRLPEGQQVESVPAAPIVARSSEHAHNHHSHAVPQQQAQNQQQYGPAPTTHPALTASDMSAALAGVGMMVQATEQRICQSMQTAVTELGTTVSTRLQGVEHVVMAQSKGLLDLQQVIVRQQLVMTQQAELLTQMQHQHLEFVRTIQTLQDSLLPAAASSAVVTTAASGEAAAAATTISNEETLAQKIRTAVMEDDGESFSVSRQQEYRETATTTTSAAQTSAEAAPISEKDDDEDKPYSRPRAADGGDAAKESEKAISAPTEDDATDVGEYGVATTATLPAEDTVEANPSAAIAMMEDDKPPSRSRAIEVEERLDVNQDEENKTEESGPTILEDPITDGKEAIALPLMEVGAKAAAVSIIEDAHDYEHASDDGQNGTDDSSPDRSRSELERPPTPEEFVLEPPDKGVGMMENESPPDTADVDLIDFSSI